MTNCTPPQSRIKYLPTPAQIRRDCESIRAGWDEDTLQTRSAARHRVDVQPLQATDFGWLDGQR